MSRGVLLTLSPLRNCIIDTESKQPLLLPLFDKFRLVVRNEQSPFDEADVGGGEVDSDGGTVEDGRDEGGRAGASERVEDNGGGPRVGVWGVTSTGVANNASLRPPHISSAACPFGRAPSLVDKSFG